jgi:hypothetical protein
MNDPRRLSEASESDLERALLRVGRAGAPHGAKQRAMLAVSATLAASSLTATAASASPIAVTAKAGSLATLKWMAVLGLTGASAVTGAVVLHRVLEGAPRPSVAAPLSPRAGADEMRSAPSAMETPAPTRPLVPESVPAIPPRQAPAPAPTVRSSPKSSEPSASNGSTLPVELAMLERARAAMGVGELTRAVSLLDGYAARYPRGAMAPEAAVLRIETLVKMGDRPAATRFANAFLAGDPHSPYAARIQSLLAAPNP